MKVTNFYFLIWLTLMLSCQHKKNLKMTYILKNKNIEIHMDAPLENYNLSRFDWTGKITSVKYKNMLVTGVEEHNVKNKKDYGKGLYNEFGIKTAIGYNETNEGDWFHKIGVGLLRKDDTVYDFTKRYDIKPATFNIKSMSNKIIIDCISQNVNGYAYTLNKEIELFESSFVIKYVLKNVGEKRIVTSEYVHNFLAITEEFIGSDYILKLPFQIKPKLFEKTFNSEDKVEIGSNEIAFNNTPKKPFFFSYLAGRNEVDASWELINTKNKIGISEKGSFKTSKVNLWGWKHVISPELFFDIKVEPGKAAKWTRTFKVFEDTILKSV